MYFFLRYAAVLFPHFPNEFPHAIDAIADGVPQLRVGSGDSFLLPTVLCFGDGVVLGEELVLEEVEFGVGEGAFWMVGRVLAWAPPSC